MVVSMMLENNFEIVKNLDLFRGLDEDFISDCFSQLRINSVEEQQTIFRQGEIPKVAFAVISGAIEVSYLSLEGDHFILDIGRESAVFGDFELLAHSPALASCTTLSPSRLLIFPKNLLLKGLHNPKFVENMMKLSYNRFNSDHILRMADRFGSLTYRVCNSLNQFSDHAGVFEGTQTYLATVIGCSRQALNREIRNLQDEGVVEVFPKMIVIKNGARITEILQGQ